MVDSVTWPPQSAPEIGTWSVGDIQPGDLVFCSKGPSADWLEIINEIAAQRWRHVASVIERDGTLYVAEIDKNSFNLRTLEAFLTAFDRYGAARLRFDPTCIARANQLMLDQIDSGHIYAWDDLILAGILSLTTRGIFVAHRARVRAALAAAAEAAKSAQVADDIDSFTCSGFIEWAYAHAGHHCRIEHERWLRADAWPPHLESIDEVLSDTGDPSPFADTTLLELLELTEVTMLQGEWKPTSDQYGEMVRVVRAAIGGAFREPPERIVTDGRWVTPTDLWESRSVVSRGLIPAPTG